MKDIVSIITECIKMKYSLDSVLNGDTSTTSLELGMGMLAIESNVLTNLIDRFTGVGGTLLLNLKSSNNMLLQFKSNPDPVLGKDNDAAIKKIKSLDFITYGENTITVPENFKGDLIEYCADLTKVLKSVYSVQDKLLPEYSMLLASFLTNKDSRKSTQDHTKFYKVVQTDREHTLKILSRYSVHNSGNRVKIKSVISRLADVPTLIKDVHALTILKNPDTLNKISVEVNKSIGMLDDLLGQIKDNKITDLSPTMVMNLSRGAYEMAKYVELVAVVYYDVSVLVSITNALVEHINKE